MSLHHLHPELTMVNLLLFSYHLGVNPYYYYYFY